MVLVFAALFPLTARQVTAQAVAQGTDPTAPQAVGMSVAELARPLHFDDLRTLRTFFERVDVSRVADGVAPPRASESLAMAAVLERMSSAWDAPFAFVQGVVRYVPYSGSVRGVHGTLESGAGNAVDQALLLQSLLAARGVPARLVRGRLQWGDAARLAVGSRSPAAPRSDDPWPRWLEGAADHWWVQGQHEGEWVDLDPSFADTAVGEAVGSSPVTHATLPEVWTTTVHIELLRGDLPVAEAVLPAGSIVGQIVALSFTAQSEAAVALWQATETVVRRQAQELRALGRGIGWLPGPAVVVRAPARAGRPSAFQRILFDAAVGPWEARLELPGRTLTAGPFELADLDSLLLRITVDAPLVPPQVFEVAWSGGPGGRLAIVVAAGMVSDGRLVTEAQPMFRSLNRLANAEQRARDGMRPPTAYRAASETLAGAARAEWEEFERAAPVALAWALLRGVDRVSNQSPAARVIRQGLRLAAVRWRPPDAARAGTLEVLMVDPFTVGQIVVPVSAASLRAANGLLQSAVFSQILNRLTDRAPETAFDITLRAIGTGRDLVVYGGADGIPATWPLAARAKALGELRAGYFVLAPASFGAGGAGWWKVSVADGETLGWVAGAQTALQGRVELGVPGRLDELEPLLASLPALHRALRWLANLSGSGGTALVSVPEAACASAAVAAEIMSSSVPAAWPRPEVLVLCGSG